MSRIKDITATAFEPAPDDFTVIDGDTNSVRKIHIGTASVRDVAATGNASSDQVVKGNDTRLVNGGSTLGSIAVASPVDGDVLQYEVSTASWRNTFKSLLTDGGNF